MGTVTHLVPKDGFRRIKAKQCVKCRVWIEPPKSGRSTVECRCGATYGLDFFRDTPIPSTGDPILDKIFS